LVSLTIFLGLFFFGCSWLPKVHLISDPLTKEEHLTLALNYESNGEYEIAEREYKAAVPLGLAYLGLGNVLYQKGEVQAALVNYRRAWQVEKIPSAANNLAWVLLLEVGPKGGDLSEALEMATLAVSRAEELALDQTLINNYRSTLRQIEQAVKAGERRGGKNTAPTAPDPKASETTAPIPEAAASGAEATASGAEAAAN
jgi:tetratricopeptide (TPR) repeat protein